MLLPIDCTSKSLEHSLVLLCPYSPTGSAGGDAPPRPPVKPSFYRAIELRPVKDKREIQVTTTTKSIVITTEEDSTVR